MKLLPVPLDPTNPEAYEGWFGQDLVLDVAYVQDTVHIGTKLHAQLCKRSTTLLMGRFSVSSTHLHHVIDNSSKFDHGLTKTDLDGLDKINFPSVLKMTDERVLNILRKQPDADGTETFLRIRRDVLDAFLKEDLSPEDRIFLMFRDAGKGDLLVPDLFESQPSERIFRAARSLTTTEATVIQHPAAPETTLSRPLATTTHSHGKKFVTDRNGSYDKVNDPHKISLYQLLAPGAGYLLMSRCWPAHRKLPGHLAIDPVSDATACSPLEPAFMPEDCDVDPVPVLTEDRLLPDEAPDADDVAVLQASTGWPQEQSPAPEVPPGSSFVVYTKDDGVQVTVRKSTLCWLYTQDAHRLSTNRFLRVREPGLSSAVEQGEAGPRTNVAKCTYICTGDWCAFQHAGKWRVGRVLAFRYLSGVGRKRTYTLPSAPVSVPEGLTARGLGCICSWFKLSITGTLQHEAASNDFVPIDNYICTLHPQYLSKGPCVICSLFVII
ncbi:Hypothetical predicted protein [Olea europaea subsp. europaea]|uniref:Uncharacterized protein n=1 Tax=Olea europaea subsp. europaea TaxID=158383 RepID=A0A8S0VL02_OLEEU|nr:Hypothetical predicted protein [Olea europaea subsp. europaea]